MTKTSLVVDEQTEIRPVDANHAEELFRLINNNRDHLQPWHPWVETLRSVADVENIARQWQEQFTNGRACFQEIWFQGKLCGMINFVSVDWSNQWAALSYWLDAGHQGKGIMTNCCRSLIVQTFDVWKFNRILIECAVENTRSRAIPERLGFVLEGIIRGAEWLQDHYADHAMYGLVRSDYLKTYPQSDSASMPADLPWIKRVYFDGVAPQADG